MHLAQFNYARLRYPLEDPRIQGFRDGSDLLGPMALRMPGIEWVFDPGPGGLPAEPVWGDPLISVNMSVWDSVAALERFVYRTLHRRWIAQRDAWFEPVEPPFQVMWWVAPGHRPDLSEALARLQLLREEGASARAFGWGDVVADPSAGAGVAGIE